MLVTTVYTVTNYSIYMLLATVSTCY